MAIRAAFIIRYCIIFLQKVARSESCQLARTMWNMFSAFEGVVDDMSPFSSEYKESPFFKRTGQRNSMFSGKMVPIWNSEHETVRQTSGLDAKLQCPNTTIDTSSVPSSPFVSQRVLGFKTSLSVSNPVLSTCKDDDLKTLMENCKLTDKNSVLEISVIENEGSVYSDWIVDEISHLRTGDTNALPKSDDETESLASSGYNTRECSPTQNREDDIDHLFREKYHNYRDPKPSVINLESNIDHVCNNIYANLRHLDNATLEDGNLVMPNRNDSKVDRSCAGPSGGLQKKSNSELNNKTQSIITDLNCDSTPPVLIKVETKEVYTSVKPSVVELTPKKSCQESLQSSRGSEKANTTLRESDTADTEVCFPQNPSSSDQMDPVLLEDYELDAEVAYIMSRSVTERESHKGNSKRRSFVLGKQRTPRRPSISSDAADSGRGSWMSSRSNSDLNSSNRRDSGISMLDLPFKPVEHVYATIPGEDCRTPVSNGDKRQVDFDNLVESSVDQDSEAAPETLDNTYASLNVSQMMTNFQTVPDTPPRLPARRYSCGEPRKRNPSMQHHYTTPKALGPKHRTLSNKPLNPKTVMPEYDEVVGSDNHHTYTIADVLESVENFAGHLPKARGNLYSLIQCRKARRRLSDCLSKKPPTGFVTAERSPRRSAYAEHQKVVTERRNSSNNVRTLDSKPPRPLKTTDSYTSPPKPPRLSSVEKFATMFDDDHCTNRPIRRSSKRGRYSLPSQQVTSPIKPREPTRPVWNYELLKSHAIYC